MSLWGYSCSASTALMILKLVYFEANKEGTRKNKRRYSESEQVNEFDVFLSIFANGFVVVQIANGKSIRSKHYWFQTLPSRIYRENQLESAAAIASKSNRVRT